MIRALVVEKNSCVKCYRQTFDKVYTAKSLKESKDIFLNKKIDALIWDCACCEPIPFDLIESISESCVVALLVTTDIDLMTLERGINAGVRFCLKKKDGPLLMRTFAMKIYNECEQLKEKKLLMSRYLLPLTTVNTLSKDYSLSSREIEVVTEALNSNGNIEIAARLFISKGTVKRHLHNVYSKLGIGSKNELKGFIYRLNEAQISTFQSPISMP